jgi:hypothetical protein
MDFSVPPWVEVALFFIRYVTCEGFPSTIYKYHLKLLTSLCFQQCINMPYFLWNNVQRMARAAQCSCQPLKTLTNHGLVKLLVMHVLEKTPVSWSQFIRLSEEELAELIPEVAETLAERDGLSRLAEAAETIAEGQRMGVDTQESASDEDEETGKPSVEVREVGGMRQVINLDSEEEEAEGSIPPNPFPEQERDVATPSADEQERDVATPSADEQERDVSILPADDHEMDVDTPSSDEQERNVATPPIYEQEVTDVVTQEPMPELSEFPVCEDGAATPPIGEQVMTDVVTQEPASEQVVPENPIFEDTTTTPPVCEQEMTDVVTQEPASEHASPENPEPELGVAIPGEV